MVMKKILSILLCASLLISFAGFSVYAVVPATTSGYTAILQEEFQTKPDGVTPYAVGETLVTRNSITYGGKFSAIKETETAPASNLAVSGTESTPTASINLATALTGKINISFKIKAVTGSGFGSNSKLVYMYNSATTAQLLDPGQGLYVAGSAPYSIRYNATSSNKTFNDGLWHNIKYEIDTTIAASNIKVTVDNATAITSTLSTIATPLNIKAIRFSKFVYVDDILIENMAPTAPVASNVVLNAPLIGMKEGNTINGSYTYSDANADAESGSTYLLEKADDSSFTTNLTTLRTGTTTASNVATDSAYTLTSNDVGKYVRFSITPQNLAETEATGTTVIVTYTANPAVSGAELPTAPVASNLDVNYLTTGTDSGKYKGYYTYFDANLDAEAGSIYKWYMSDTETGTYSEISGENLQIYSANASDVGKYLKFEVTPQNDNTPTTGIAVQSGSIKIENYSVYDNFETKADGSGVYTAEGQSVVGWTGTNAFTKQQSDSDNTTYGMYSAATGNAYSAYKTFASAISGNIVVEFRLRGYTNTSQIQTVGLYSPDNAINTTPVLLIKNMNSSLRGGSMGANIADGAGQFTVGKWYKVRWEIDTTRADNNFSYFVDDLYMGTENVASLSGATIDKIAFGYLANVDDVKVYALSAARPTVSNISIDKAQVNQLSTLSYSFNGSTETGSRYYIANATAIDETYTNYISTNNTFTPTEALANKYIKIKVLPIQTTEPYIGIPSESTPSNVLAFYNTAVTYNVNGLDKTPVNGLISNPLEVGDNTIAVSETFNNYDSNSNSARVVIAIYNSNKELIGISLSDEVQSSIAANSTGNLISATISKNITESGCFAKVFVWKDISTIIPLIDSVTIQ